jgi:hypothetical protein
MKISNNPAICPICPGGGTSGAHWERPCFRRCKRCDAIFRDPFPSGAELNHLYQSSWADLDAHLDETGGTNLELGRRMLTALLRELD